MESAEFAHGVHLWNSGKLSDLLEEDEVQPVCQRDRAST